jgi:hypothetical protein
VGSSAVSADRSALAARDALAAFATEQGVAQQTIDDLRLAEPEAATHPLRDGRLSRQH